MDMFSFLCDSCRKTEKDVERFYLYILQQTRYDVTDNL